MTTAVSSAVGPVGTHPMHPVPYRVVGRRAPTADVAVLELAPVEDPVADPRPGQFAMLWAPGVGEVPISFSGLADAPRSLQVTVRSVGEVSAALVAAQPGAVLGLRGPYGRGWDLDPAPGRDVLVVAGGIGLVPLWPLLAEIERRRPDLGAVALAVGSRRPSELLDADGLHAWAERTGAHLGITVDVPEPGWAGDVGLVTSLLDRTGVTPGRARAFVCGPEVMMRAVGRRLLTIGFDPAQVLVSLERNMACGIRQCGRCQLGPVFVCTDGPVFAWPEVARLMEVPSR